MGPASRLDAFSGYQFRTWLPGRAMGMTTRKPAVRSLRSSRTRSNPPQLSYARGRYIEVPNTAVDMNSWAVSACYPQSTFYPLSDGPSMRDHRITMTCFRTCSSCGSRSQAGLCHYTDLTVSDRNQPTFVLLRYPLGGDRPSQTSRQTLSAHRAALEPQNCQGGISRTTPSRLAS